MILLFYICTHVFTVFSDDFASFTGFTRFKQNLSTLALLTRDYSVRVLSFDVDDHGEGDCLNATASTRALVCLELKLPWRPVLKWVWKVKHVLTRIPSHLEDDDENTSNQTSTRGDTEKISRENYVHVVEHVESWEIDKDKGVALLFKPGPDSGWPFR